MPGRYTRAGIGALLLLAFVGMAPLGAASNYIVSGVVVDSRSRTPLPHAMVSLAPITARERKLEQVTKQDGRFSFPVNEPGKYELSLIKPGYPRQDYKQDGFSGAASAIAVRDGQDTTHIVFEAARGGTITGVVKDEGSEPVGNAQVAIFQSAVVGGNRRMVTRGQLRANAVGEFRLSNLPRGDYYVCAMGRPWFADSVTQLQDIQDRARMVGRARAAVRANPEEQEEPPALTFSPDPVLRGTALLPTFYPNARSADQAAPIRLDTGGEAQVSIVLPFTAAVSVRGTLSVPGEVSGGRVILLKRVYDESVLFLEQWVGKNKTFQFQNVPPGSYEILASSQADSGASSWAILEQVEVGASDMEVTLRPQPFGSLSGRVLFEGEHPAPAASLLITLRDERGGLLRAEVNPEGGFSLSRLLAGRYEVTAGNTDYIAECFRGPAGERLPLTLTISAGENVWRDLTLTRAVSVIEGTVEKAGVPQVGAFVLLMPKNATEQWAYRIDQTDSDGSYGLQLIPSGDYFLIALNDGDGIVYRDAKVAARLSKVAKLVHVEPGDHLELKMDVVSATNLALSSL
jgi:hypothetical protein